MGMNELETAEIYRQTLLSARDGIRLDDWAIESRAVTPGCSVPWSIRKLALHGGKQEGVDLVILNNGRLRDSCRADTWNGHPGCADGRF